MKTPSVFITQKICIPAPEGSVSNASPASKKETLCDENAKRFHHIKKSIFRLPKGAFQMYRPPQKKGILCDENAKRFHHTKKSVFGSEGNVSNTSPARAEQLPLFMIEVLLDKNVNTLLIFATPKINILRVYCRSNRELSVTDRREEGEIAEKVLPLRAQFSITDY